ncbi:glycosyltransferase family 22 protein [Suillus clintonianus]|uniref:glycosyltransferase family 22 protein n=1 Tax=Suillus clintonianus TaxID=1904413 RepID=UPI001B87E1F3|nr:glycosyltransferase family 22 protein [Suillus clintonianus]KAG2134780.1 glycosyltransferase family 22 protein [Suillus clintonianus]
MISTRTFKWIYAGLWILRTCFALFGTGYIHPDEHMQNGEVTSGDLLAYHTVRTWEWSTACPVRSIVPAFATTGIPVWFAEFLSKKYLTWGVQPVLLFRLERFAFLVISGLIDYSLTSLVPRPRNRLLGLLLLASSHVMNTFQVRPFSNSIEAVLVGLSLALLRKINSVKALDKRYYLHLLAITFVTGIFTRPTFLIFGAPIAYQVALGTFTRAGTAARWLRLVVPPLSTSAAACTAFLVADTLYFRGALDDLVVTPFNFLKYNFSSHNLAGHGLHPRWLHVFVNLPMLFGPWVLWLGVRAIVDCAISFNEKNDKSFEVNVLCPTIIQMIILSLTVLSVQPHQEPRFLVPLLLPIIVLIANTGRLAHVGKAFWVSCSIFNLVLAVLFGVLHQGGVVPSLFHLHSVVANASLGTRTNIVYWKTYMPPPHFLGVREQDISSGMISFVDLAGASQHDFTVSLSAGGYDRTFIVTPVAMQHTLPPAITDCMELDKSIFPHLDLDHISESVDTGLLDGLRLGVYILSPACDFV